MKTARLAAALACALPFAAAASDFDAQLRAMADARLRAIAADETVVAAIRARNAAGALPADEIARLDAEWRAQVGAAASPLVDEIAGAPASARLIAARDASQGLLTEIFAMDAQGLNVAMSDATSDYWQGDEAKWSETYRSGAIHISDVELDESTQSFQAQVSLPVFDPDGGAPIGAITFGVNVELLD